MTDETTTQETSSTAAATQAPASKGVTLAMKVAERIAGSGTQVENAVVAVLANKEIERRTNLVVSTMAELDKLDKEHKKMKPDQVFYKEDKSVLSEGFSKAVIESREKNRVRFNKISKALDKALNTNDFGDLNNVNSGGATE